MSKFSTSLPSLRGRGKGVGLYGGAITYEKNFRH